MDAGDSMLRLGTMVKSLCDAIKKLPPIFSGMAKEIAKANEPESYDPTEIILGPQGPNRGVRVPDEER